VMLKGAVRTLNIMFQTLKEMKDIQVISVFYITHLLEIEFGICMKRAL
jgi:hypothetical protein